MINGKLFLFLAGGRENNRENNRLKRDEAHPTGSAVSKTETINISILRLPKANKYDKLAEPTAAANIRGVDSFHSREIKIRGAINRQYLSLTIFLIHLFWKRQTSCKRGPTAVVT